MEDDFYHDIPQVKEKEEVELDSGQQQYIDKEKDETD